ncbi:ABC transporter permease [Stygiobacter electus]|uniref:ABC transporter permease n=1 Tax=Stygiobacter electus TaxID=3032292 RepID=A0AAE3P060_9BACT|nr:ABC transporter permease [Stygiobacter electus]MDF1611302.1 ABC transporter permease [Stygiobacter electus]
MITLINIELQKIFKKWRTYIGFIAVFVMTTIVQIALYLTQDDFIRSTTRALNDSFFLQGNFFNGYVVAYLILNAMFIHIPFLIVLVGGDLFAGEATAGTYRMVLTRPISKFNFVTSKFLAGFIYTFIFILFIVLISLLGSVLFFGTGELVSLKNKIIIFASNDVLWRLIGAYIYAILSMMTVMALSIFFSSMVSNAIGPIVSTMAVIIVFIILSAIPIEVLQNLRPYFFTSHLSQWNEFFNDPIDYNEIKNSAIILFAHIIALYGLTTFIFLKKDILS